MGFAFTSAGWGGAVAFIGGLITLAMVLSFVCLRDHAPNRREAVGPSET